MLREIVKIYKFGYRGERSSVLPSYWRTRAALSLSIGASNVGPLIGYAPHRCRWQLRLRQFWRCKLGKDPSLAACAAHEIRSPAQAFTPRRLICAILPAAPPRTVGIRIMADYGTSCRKTDRESIERLLGIVR